MSSGVAMNRKLERDAGARSVNNKFKNTNASFNQGNVQSRMQNRNQTKHLPPVFVRGSPSQKNWYVLNLHEKRLARLETWAHLKNLEEVGEGDENREFSTREIQQRLTILENENKLLRQQLGAILEKKGVSFEVEEN